MWTFPASYAQATWKRLLPFFLLPGTIPHRGQMVQVELRPFNDRALNRDLAIMCERINQDQWLLACWSDDGVSRLPANCLCGQGHQCAHQCQRDRASDQRTHLSNAHPDADVPVRCQLDVLNLFESLALTNLPLLSASGNPTAIAASLAHSNDAPMPQRAAPKSRNHSLPYRLLQ